MRALLTAFAFLFCATAARAEAGNWTTTCTDDGRCTALITLSDDATKRTLLSVGLQIGQGGTEPVLIALLPSGVELRPGFRAVIGSKTFDATYEVCFPDGCRATLPMAAEDLAVWLSGQPVSLRFFPFGAEKPVGVDAPLDGLREALKDTLAPAK